MIGAIWISTRRFWARPDLVCVGRNRLRGTEADSGHAALVDALAAKIGGNRAGAAFGQILVMLQAAGRIRVAVDVDQGAVELTQNDCDGIERREELRLDGVLVDVESDRRRHVQNDAVAGTGNRNAGTLQLRAQLGFLLVHIVADAGTCERTDAGADQRGIAARSRRMTDEKTSDSTDTGTERSTARRIRYFLLARIGVGRGARVQKTCR